MSTKIYYGFRMQTDDLNEAFGLIHGLRPAVADMTKEYLSQWLAKQVQGHLDMPSIMPDNQEIANAAKRPYAVAISELWERQKEVRQTGNRDPEVDTDFELALIPVDLADGEHPVITRLIVGIVYTEQNDWYDWFMEQDGIEPFGYWDNSDRDEEVSEVDWNYRRLVWEKAFPNNRTPAEMGMTIQLHPSVTPYLTAVDIFPQVKPREERAQRYAHNLVRDIYFNERLNEAVEGGQTRKDFFANDGVRLVMEAEDFAQSDDGRAERDKLYPQVLEKLPEITVEMIQGEENAH